MTGPAEGKIELKNAKIYIHKKDPSTRSRIIHIDIEHPDINNVMGLAKARFAQARKVASLSG